MSDSVFARRDPKSGEYPTEPKVIATTATSTALMLLTTIAMTAVQDENVPLLLGFLPEWLEPIALAAVTGAVTFYTGWRAKHQHRRPASAGGQ